MEPGRSEAENTPPEASAAGGGSVKSVKPLPDVYSALLAAAVDSVRLTAACEYSLCLSFFFLVCI